MRLLSARTDVFTVGQTVLRAGNTVNPLIVLANYVFDTLPQDVYQFRGNTMFEGRITTGTNLTSTTALDEEERCKALLSNMDNLWSYQPLDPEMPVFPVRRGWHSGVHARAG